MKLSLSLSYSINIAGISAICLLLLGFSSLDWVFYSSKGSCSLQIDGIIPPFSGLLLWCTRKVSTSGKGFKLYSSCDKSEQSSGLLGT